jgi:hypothetical protein
VLTGGKKKWCDSCGGPTVRRRRSGDLSLMAKCSEHGEWDLSEGMSLGGGGVAKSELVTQFLVPDGEVRGWGMDATNRR